MQECTKCRGYGYYADHDLPTRHGEDGECVSCPIQVQCKVCQGTGEMIAPQFAGGVPDNRPEINDLPF